MELEQRLKELKLKLAMAADIEQVRLLTDDITRVRKAIVVDQELRSASGSAPRVSEALGDDEWKERAKLKLNSLEKRSAEPVYPETRSVEQTVPRDGLGDGIAFTAVTSGQAVED